MNTNAINNSIFWGISLLLAVLAIFVIGMKWQGVVPQYNESDFIRISNQADLDKVLNKSTTVEFANGQKPIRIPTGFFIQSFSFVNANDVNFVGYIWMKFPHTLPDDFTQKFIFPEEVQSNSTRTELIYTLEQEDYTLKGWFFDVIVRQSFDYTNYPLDYQSIWLRIWSKDFIHDQEVIIIPDFDSYLPDSLKKKYFGLDEDIVPSGWNILETFYTMKTQTYDTSFGFDTFQGYQNYTEMYYNIGIHRSIVDAFIINLVPLFFATLLLFSLVMTVRVDEKQKSHLGFNTVNTIAICASLLFIVVLLHVQIRRQFVGSELVYTEYFYLIVYLMIFLTTFNSYIVTGSKHRIPALITWRDNLLPKILYWPLLLWMMAIATVIKI